MYTAENSFAVGQCIANAGKLGGFDRAYEIGEAIHELRTAEVKELISGLPEEAIRLCDRIAQVHINHVNKFR